MGFADNERVPVKKECLRMIARLKLDPARTKLLTGFVDTYLRLTESEQKRFSRELKKLPENEREQVMELTTSWKEEGIQLGLQQGIEREADLILRMLKRRVGKLDEDACQRVRALPVTTLESLGEALLDFAGPADLRRWLDQQPPQSTGKPRPKRKA